METSVRCSILFCSISSCLLGDFTGARADEPNAAYEMDRPGEVENPFALKPGQAQVVVYGVAANAGGREDQNLGEGGAANLIESGVRFGLFPGWEGEIFSDAFLSAKAQGADGDDPSVTRAGFGDITFRAKYTLINSDNGEAGLGIVPFVKLPLLSSLVGTSGAESGVLVPFEVDLEHGWDLEGSIGASRSHEDGRAITEAQAGPEWQFIRGWTSYFEGEMEVSRGRPEYSMEAGFTHEIARHLQLDVGGSKGLGQDSRSHMLYLGLSLNL